MKSHRLIPFAMLVLAVFLSGCAAMFTGTRDNVMFQTTPPGATVIAGKD
jgi:hypothetical protein